MIRIVYYISIFFYQITIVALSFAVRISALWHPKHKLWVDGRNDVLKRIAASITSGEKRIWIHCSSLGEFEQGRPLIEQLKKTYPDYKIFLTFFSPSGFEIRKDYALADNIFYLPSDTRKNAKRFIELVNPQLVIFVKYEFWFNYLNSIQKNKIPLILISAIFNSEKAFFKPWGILFRKMLEKIDYIFVQDSQSKELLSSIGINNVLVAPDTRIDRVLQISNEGWKSDIHEVELFCGNSHILIAGSSYNIEEEYISKMIKNPDFNWKIIIAPHKIDTNHIDNIRNLFANEAVFWSDIKSITSPNRIENYRILVIDTIGLLSHLYKYASVAFIGGGYGKSIHNILEPATFGLPIIIGPNNHQKFKEALDMIALNGVFLVKNYTEFEFALTQMQDDNKRLIAGSASRKYITDNSGGTSVIMGFLKNCL